MTKILLTGATGFLGSALLNSNNFKDIVVLGRNRPKECENFLRTDFDTNKTLFQELKNYEVIIHMVGRAHIFEEKSNNPLEEYKKINTGITKYLAEQASKAGVKRFIFLSTVKVLGEKSAHNYPYNAFDIPNPKDFYAMSKLEAEKELIQVCDDSDMEYVIIRPPLIYGRKVKGNFLKLMKLVSMSLPIPLGSIDNKRSLVSTDNLIDLISTCVDHPNAKNQIFLVSDGKDVSTSELLKILIRSRGCKTKLFKFNKILLKYLLYLLGKQDLYERLFSSLQVDITHTKTQLEWHPRYKIEESLEKCWSSIE